LEFAGSGTKVMQTDQHSSNELLNSAIRRIGGGEDLAREQARDAMNEILSGAVETPDIVAFLKALNTKPYAVEELIGFAQAIRAKAVPVRPRRPVEEDISGTERDALVDTAGTGGDASGTFNISTATALVVAGCGVRVAKHGNRSNSTRCGSADVIEGLGVNMNLPPERIAECIDTVGIGFMFAPAMHAAMKHAVPARRELKSVRTVFNLLGPLCNPAGASAQVIGVYDGRLTGLLAHALVELGLRRGFVVHGADGLDEISNTAETTLAEVHQGRVTMHTVSPEQFGLPRHSLADLQGGEVAENVQIIRSILDGESGARREIVLLNAAAALTAAEHARDLQHGIELAATSIDSGQARAKLAALVEFTARHC
jgi:anthranilate phosphoribosyltransferase